MQQEALHIFSVAVCLTGSFNNSTQYVSVEQAELIKLTSSSMLMQSLLS
jgi:hypothetical protein